MKPSLTGKILLNDHQQICIILLHEDPRDRICQINFILFLFDKLFAILHCEFDTFKPFFTSSRDSCS